MKNKSIYLITICTTLLFILPYTRTGLGQTAYPTVVSSKSEEKEIKELIKQLGNKNKQTKNSTRDRLCKLGEIIMPYLETEEGLNSTDPEVKSDASAVLSQLMDIKFYFPKRVLDKEDQQLWKMVGQAPDQYPYVFYIDWSPMTTKYNLTKDEINRIVDGMLFVATQLNIKQDWALDQFARFEAIPTYSYSLGKLLFNKDPRIRHKTITLVQDNGKKELTPLLQKLLKDESDALFSGAVSKEKKETNYYEVELEIKENVKTMSKWEIKESVPDITKLLDHKSDFIRCECAQALAKMGVKDAAFKILATLPELEFSTSPKVIIESLVSLNNKEIIPALLELLKTPKFKSSDWHSGYVSIILQGLDGKAGATPLLIAMLDNRDYQNAAIKILYDLDAKEAIPEIKKILDKDKSQGDYYTAIRALSLWGERDIIPLLIKMISVESDQYKSHLPEVAFALGRLDAKESIPHLIKLLPSHPTIGVLAKLQAKEALPAIAEYLKSDKPYPRQAAINAIAALDGKEYIDQIIKRCEEDKDNDVIIAAINALGQLGDPKAIPVLIQAKINNEKILAKREKKEPVPDSEYKRWNPPIFRLTSDVAIAKIIKNLNQTLTVGARKISAKQYFMEEAGFMKNVSFSGNAELRAVNEYLWRLNRFLFPKQNDYLSGIVFNSELFLPAEEAFKALSTETKIAFEWDEKVTKNLRGRLTAICDAKEGVSGSRFAQNTFLSVFSDSGFIAVPQTNSKIKIMLPQDALNLYGELLKKAN